jgi:hypothetical protein
MSITGDALVSLLGHTSGAPDVQASLVELAHGMQPSLDPDDDDSFVDWITVNELGLEFGFEDEAFVHAFEASRRRRGPLLLTQVCFYGDTANTRPFPYALPFGLSFDDDRAAARHKLSEREPCRRSYVRDTWSFPRFHVTLAYNDNERLESILCYLPYTPWPVPENEHVLVSSFTPEALIALFGMRWSSAELRSRLAPLGFDLKLGEVRSEHNADLRLSHGIEFGFAAGRKIPSADPQFPDSLSFKSVTYYGPRVYDSRQWIGELPLDLAFSDSQAGVLRKVGRNPDKRADFDRNGFMLWHFQRYSLRVEYSNIENRALRITLLAPGYWTAVKAELAQ